MRGEIEVVNFPRGLRILLEGLRIFQVKRGEAFSR